MNNRKASYITLICSLCLSVAQLVILFLGVFGVLVPTWHIESSFNYLVAFCLIAVNLILDVVFMVIENKKLLEIPEWFRVVFFIGFFVFTNIYYFFNLYNLIYTSIIFYIYIAVVLSILSISIFYNVQREGKTAKVNNKFAAVSTFTYATSMFLVIETIITALRTLFNSVKVTNALTLFLINSCIAILISLVIAIIFYVSLTKTKKIVNRCLIKINNVEPEKIEENK